MGRRLRQITQLGLLEIAAQLDRSVLPLDPATVITISEEMMIVAFDGIDRSLSILNCASVGMFQ